MLLKRLDYTLLPLLMGAVLIALGGSVLYGWLAQQAALVQWRPGMMAMVLPSAFCFLLAGTALLHAYFRPARTRFPLTIAYVLMAVAALAMMGMLIGHSALLDQTALHAWLEDPNPHPGRMAPQSAFGFFAAGLTLWLLYAKGHSGLRTRLAVGLIALVFATGLTGLIGYGLELDLLFDWFDQARMALPTATGMLLLGPGLWGVYSRAAAARHIAPLPPDERINLIGSLTLVIVAVATGLAGFVMLQERTRAEIARGLSQGLKNQLIVFDNAVDQRRKTAYVLAHDPRIVAAAKALDRNETRTDFRALLAVHSAENLRAATLRNVDDSESIEVGAPFAADTLIAELHGDAPAYLIWEKQYLLKVEQPVYDARGRLIAYLDLIEAAPELDRMFLARAGFGSTGELRVCVLRGERAQCFPQSRQPQLYSTAAAQSEAMFRAMRGEGGEFSGEDFRGNRVIAAYAPLPGPDLGITLKQDAVEIYKPISDRLKLALPVLLLLAAAGAMLLRLQVKPLTKRLVASEQKARQAMLIAAESEERTQAVLSNIGDGIVISDRTGRIESANPAALSIFGYTEAEIVDRNLDMLMPEGMRARHDAAVSKYKAGGEPKMVDQGPIYREGLHKNGERIPLEISVTRVNHGEELRFVGIMRDISARVAAETALHAEKERLHVTLHSIGDAVITTDTQARITYLNPAAEEMTGWLAAEAEGRPVSEVFRIVMGGSDELAPCPVEAVLLSGRASGLPQSAEMLKRDNRRIAIEDSAAPIHHRNGDIAGVVIVFHDVTEARELSRSISYQATHDALTDLFNRRAFERHLADALFKADGGNPMALLYLDLDQFKIVNDTCGHFAGDELLKQIAHTLKSCLRADDVLARLGGDEFAVILEQCPPHAAMQIADALRQDICDFQFVWEDKAFSVGASIGLVQSDGQHTLSDLLKAADSACYMAKEKGRNRVHVYEETDVELIRRSGEIGWVARIEKALNENRFELYAQPIEALNAGADSRESHYEILVRMTDEAGNSVPPGAFIPAAERYGLMSRVDRWVIEKTFDLLDSPGFANAPISVAINLSAMSINEESLLGYLREQFRSRSLDPRTVIFEITETSAIANLTQSSRAMRELKALGCRFALDDFGSGMSSFAYLKNLPVDYIKIDGSFVKDMVDDPIDREMVASINNMAHVMNIKTVAEFAESEEILRHLRQIGVDYAQGFAISVPIPVEKIKDRSRRAA